MILARGESAFHGLTPRGGEGGLGPLGLVRSQSPSPEPRRQERHLGVIQLESR